eukprot:984318-Prymnesium_polylepis.1
MKSSSVGAGRLWRSDGTTQTHRRQRRRTEVPRAPTRRVCWSSCHAPACDEIVMPHRTWKSVNESITQCIHRVAV